MLSWLLLKGIVMILLIPTRKLLYCSFVRSLLEYASVIWCPFSDVHIKRLERVQRKFTKFAILPLHITIDPPPSYETRCAFVNLQSLEIRRSIQSLLFLYDIINYNINCSELLTQVRFNVPCRLLRKHNYFHVDLHRTNYSLNELLTRAQNYFNKLSDNSLLDFSYSCYINSLYERAKTPF